jgi:hypothetical protein
MGQVQHLVLGACTFGIEYPETVLYLTGIAILDVRVDLFVGTLW